MYKASCSFARRRCRSTSTPPFRRGTEQLLPHQPDAPGRGAGNGLVRIGPARRRRPHTADTGRGRSQPPDARGLEPPRDQRVRLVETASMIPAYVFASTTPPRFTPRRPAGGRSSRTCPSAPTPFSGTAAVSSRSAGPRRRYRSPRRGRAALSNVRPSFSATARRP